MSAGDDALEVAKVLGSVAGVLTPIAASLRVQNEEAYQLLCRHITETSDLAMTLQIAAQKEITK